MKRKLYRNCKKWIWISCIFFIYFLFDILSIKSYRKLINIPSNAWPPFTPLEYKIIKSDLISPSVFNNFSMKRESIIDTKYPISTYYRLLNEYTGVCRKLARFGGILECREHNETEYYHDGHKFICMEPELQILKSSNIKDCLVLSFGTMFEISFDLSAREANCEVHLYDVVDFGQFLDLNDTFMTFHQVGLGDKNSNIFYKDKNLDVTFHTLEYILYNLNATSRLINILKIDIEGNEWKVLDYLLNKSFLLGSVGQIAIEVHDFNYATQNSVSELYKYKIKILLQLEEAGFRRVKYNDNIKSGTATDEFGIKHLQAGELLLINMNWYEDDYLKNLKESLQLVKYKFIHKL